MSPEDVNKTAVVTPFGLWEFLKMPYCLRNAGQTFQRLMDQVCAGLTFTFVYLDDVLVSSQEVLLKFNISDLSYNDSSSTVW